MIAVVLKGILLGLSIALFFGFGPSFIAVFQTALHKGYFKGALMALGVFLSDILMVTVSLLGAKSVVENSEKYEVLGVIGGIILIIFGIFILKKHAFTTKSEKMDIEINPTHPLLYTAKGFLLNIANPFIWIFWAGVVMGVAAPLKAKELNIIIFLASALLTIFTVDLVKVVIANKIKPLINDRFLSGLNKASGFMLIIFGIILLIKTFIEYYGI